MKKLFLLSIRFLLVCCLSVAALQTAQASHAQAGQITYSYIGTTAFPNRYRIDVQFFRDCSGILPSGTAVNCRANGCNGTLVTGTLTQVGQPITGAPYCPVVQATVQCDGTVGQLTNYQIYTYQCTVDLPPAAEWVISWEESARPTIANISAGTLRLEATLNNLITPTGGGAAQPIINNSPVFSTVNLPVTFAYVNDPATLSFSATDGDLLGGGQSDSLVYSLDRPLNGCGSYETYLTNPQTTPCISAPLPLPNPQPCALFCNLPAGNSFSANLPLPVALDTIGACPYRTVQPRFYFNASVGSFAFTPNYWNPNASTNYNAGNKYVLVGKVTEYRKINGVYYKVGSVRRDFLVVIVLGAGNNIPGTPTCIVQPAMSGSRVSITRDTTELVVRTCNYSRFTFTFTDPNNTLANPNTQNLRVYSDPTLNSIGLRSGDIGSFVVAGDGTPRPTGTFYFQPSASAAGTVITTTLRIEDNACPIKGVQYRTLRIRVVRGSTARVAISGQGKNIIDLCNSAPLTLQGQVNRPDSVRAVAANATVAQTYNYQWTVVGTGNGLPAVTNTATIAVSPTVTTRYRLSINPQYGFGSSGICGDTSSILVRVVPAPPTPIITRNGSVLTSSATTGNQWLLNNQPIPGATSQTYVATTNGAYSVAVTTANGTGTTGCTVTSATILSAQHALPGSGLIVAPNPTHDGQLSVTLTGYRQATYLTLFDALGRPVRQEAILAPNPAGTTQRLDLAPLASGLYILQVRTAGGVDTRQIVRE